MTVALGWASRASLGVATRTAILVVAALRAEDFRGIQHPIRIQIDAGEDLLKSHLARHSDIPLSLIVGDNVRELLEADSLLKRCEADVFFRA